MWSVYMPASQNTMKFVTIIFVPVCHPSHQGVAQEAAFDVDASRGSPKSCCIQARRRTAIGKNNREMHMMTRGLHIAYACSIIYTT